MPGPFCVSALPGEWDAFEPEAAKPPETSEDAVDGPAVVTLRQGARPF